MKRLIRYLGGCDKILYLLCLLASVCGIVVIYGISQTFTSISRSFIVQVAASSIGIVLVLIVSLIDYHTLARLWKLHLPFALFLVLLTFFLGTQRGGADDKAWLMLPGNIIGIQPAELLKVSFIMTFALHLSKVKEQINRLGVLIPVVLHACLPLGLIHLQGDDGTALIFAFIIVAMLFAAGLSWKYFAAAGAAACAAAPVLWLYVLNYDQKQRILVLFEENPDPLGIAHQQLEGLISIGSGQLKGIGLLNAEHRYVPELHNDFVLSFIGEALGFFGCVGVLLVLFAVCARILMDGLKSKDNLGLYMCVGVFAMIASQTVVNIGMCLMVLPVIGVTLPFFSSGGTSVVSIYLGIGIVMSVYMHNKVLLFE